MVALIELPSDNTGYMLYKSIANWQYKGRNRRNGIFFLVVVMTVIEFC